jgi:hypothetical protein
MIFYSNLKFEHCLGDLHDLGAQTTAQQGDACSNHRRAYTEGAEIAFEGQ